MGTHSSLIPGVLHCLSVSILKQLRNYCMYICIAHLEVCVGVWEVLWGEERKKKDVFCKMVHTA